MKYAICIIARNEQGTIANVLDQISRQSLLHQSDTGSLYVVCNGCTDKTSQLAQDVILSGIFPPGFRANVLDFEEGGKARSWNLAVHEIITPDIDHVIFLDADIDLADDEVLSDLAKKLQEFEGAMAVSGWPVKDIVRKPRKSLLDRFSLKVSAQTSYGHAINGSLYIARMSELRRIWLPVPIPGEDGMLTAMIHTEGFSRPEKPERIIRIDRPTHYFEAHSVIGFLRHEQRMTVGTTINGWLCEHFWGGSYTTHVGDVVRRLNEQKPGWVDLLVKKNVGDKGWALPPRLLTWRLQNLRDTPFSQALVRGPFSLAATILNIVPCVLANRTLKQKAASSYW